MFNPNDPALDPLKHACTESGRFDFDLATGMLAIEVAVEFLGATVETVLPFVAGKMADGIEAQMRRSASSSFDSSSAGDIRAARARHRQVLLLRNIAARKHQEA
jgi:hypothetical protein